MAAVPDPFRPAARHRMRDEPNEDELGKALPETVIRQLDARLHLLGPAGRAGSITAARPAADAPDHLPDPARHRPAPRRGREPAHRLRRGHRRPAQPDLRQPQGRPDAPPAADHLRHRRAHHGLAAAPRRAASPAGHPAVAVPQPAAAGAAVPRARHRRPASAGRSRSGSQQIGTIDCELLGPDGTPAPFDPSLVAPYALRHSYAQRHADAGVPVDVLKELMDHVVG